MIKYVKQLLFRKKGLGYSVAATNESKWIGVSMGEYCLLEMWKFVATICCVVAANTCVCSYNDDFAWF
ncbi:hypothetical protein K4L44_08790 [Halosquirtibacter laminarini]|uniref:Uncharacterized protein n=1 Tax=Halosquirtibacter laminarini TaxID=3374600 RepID=A0AC61NQF1_9BACT|nr:hypothetical protein K4L44_08790 [Prolixibacteraceae bacterium]